MKRIELKRIIEKIAPESLAFSWDNSGFNISLHDDIKKVLVAFDLKPQTIEYAKEIGADTVITHHPILFNPLKQIDCDDAIGKVAIEAVKLGLNVYCAHTSFDCSEYGTDAVFSGLLGMKNCRVLLPEGEWEGKVYGIGRSGELEEEINSEEFIKRVKASLKIGTVRTNGIRKIIKRAACIGGSGGADFAEAVKEGADVLVTGEAKYNNFLDAAALGLLLIEVGHFDSEKAFVETMSRHLQKENDVLLCNLEVCSYADETAPYDFV